MLADMARWSKVALSVWSVWMAWPAVAQVEPLQSVSAVIKEPAKAQIGGDFQAADPTKWPATLFAMYDEGKCTSTYIGPQAILTAAHCVRSGARRDIGVVGSTTHYFADCERHPQYRDPPGGGLTPQSSVRDRVDASFDVALCKVNRIVPSVRFEKVSRKPLMLNASIIVLGFGCSDWDRRDGYGPLIEAPSKAYRLPGKDGDNFLEINSVGTSIPFYCTGDSGGAVYRWSGFDREIVGVASEVVTLKQGNRTVVAGPSYAASILPPAAGQRDFLQEWSGKGAEYEICGINSAHSRCPQ